MGIRTETPWDPAGFWDAVNDCDVGVARVGGVETHGVRLDADVHDVIERCAAEGVNPGYPLGADYEEFDDGLLVAITEQRTREDIDRLAEVLGRAVAGARRARRPEEVTA